MAEQLYMDSEITEEILDNAGFTSFREGVPEVDRLVEVFCFPLHVAFPHDNFLVVRGMVHANTNVNTIEIQKPATMVSVEDGEIVDEYAIDPPNEDTVKIDQDKCSAIYWKYNSQPTIILPKKKKQKTDPEPREAMDTTKKFLPPIKRADTAARTLQFAGKTKKTRKSRKTKRKSRRKK